MVQPENTSDHGNELHLTVPTMSDMFVHFLFGSKKYESALICFVNAVLSDVFRKPIKTVTVRNPFSVQMFLQDKTTILDIVAEDENSRLLDIEIQIVNYRYFEERTLYYWAKLYASQLTKSESYKTLKPVVSIILTDFQVFKELDSLHTTFHITSNDDKRVLLTDHFEMHFLRVPERIDDQTPMDVSPSLKCWLTFFGYPKKTTEAMMLEVANSDAGVQAAEDAYGDFMQTPEYCQISVLRDKIQRDRISQLETRWEEGREEGREEGLIAGEAKGKAQVLVKILDRQLGPIPAELKTKILQMTDGVELDRLTDIALSTTSLEQFNENFR